MSPTEPLDPADDVQEDVAERERRLDEALEATFPASDPIPLQSTFRDDPGRR